nr:MAG TPA: hypothetical protein [Caudoviricetes sp.]
MNVVVIFAMVLSRKAVNPLLAGLLMASLPVVFLASR